MKIEIELNVKDESIKKHFKDFVQSLASRLEQGEKEYGPSTYKSMNLSEELIEEMLDIPNYLFFKYIRLKEDKK